MNDIRRYITILENASEDELQKYRDEEAYWQNERKKYWPVSPELLAQYKDGTHTEKNIFDSLIWRQNLQWHRDSDKPAYIGKNGTLFWYQNARRHRDGDKPAVIYPNGSLEWWQNGQHHRICGPAVIYPTGRQEWWINNENITKEVNAWLAGEEWQGTPEQIFEFKLRFT